MISFLFLFGTAAPEKIMAGTSTGMLKSENHEIKRNTLLLGNLLVDFYFRFASTCSDSDVSRTELHPETNSPDHGRGRDIVRGLPSNPSKLNSNDAEHRRKPRQHDCTYTFARVRSKLERVTACWSSQQYVVEPCAAAPPNSVHQFFTNRRRFLPAGATASTTPPTPDISIA